MAKQLLDNITQKNSTGSPLRWLDWFDYGQKVILNNRDIPWGDPASFVNFLNQGQSLLKLGVSSIPLTDYFSWWVAQKPAALEEMSGKKRVGFALKNFLANSSLRKDLKELVSAAAASSSTPVVLSIPSPRQMLVWAHSAANKLNGAIELEEVAVDSATVYLADFLREFADTQVAGVLVHEADEAKLTDKQLALYQPIVNIADAYQWTVGVKSVGSTAAGFSALDLMISTNVEACRVVTSPLPSSFWSEGGKCEGAFVYGTVPVDAVPEKVLEVLEALSL